MPNVAQVLKSEIQRVARKEAKAVVDPIKKENIALRKKVSELQKMVNKLQSGHKQVVKKVMPKETPAEKGTENKASRIRPTGQSLVKLRNKFGMTQDQFSQLLNVGRITVARWEKQDGKLKLRQSALDSIASVQKLGKREAQAKLAAAE